MNISPAGGVTEVTENTERKDAILSLREEVRGPVAFLLSRLKEDLGENLSSLSVVGSALTRDFHPKHSDINTVLVVGRRSHELLKRLASRGREMGRRRLRAPLVMTAEYIERSADVFGVEFLDFQLNHLVVHGSDPFADLRFEKEDVRLQCERELKAALITLRQGYIRALGKPRIVAGLLTACAVELAVLLRAMLWLNDVDRPREALPTLEAAAGKLGFDAEAVRRMMTLKLEHAQPQADEIETLFEGIYQVVDHLSRTVDAFGKVGDA